ncbi:tRNA-splicing endonuclease subunit Sen15 [Xylariomycetidae sp. FL2044]|nr:tRNA-splicing endonuclease subunit Sen15 [Xylariomycetidae sp. FL2044]
MSQGDHTKQLVDSVLENLRYQHDWTQLQITTTSPIDQSALARPLISGLPPTRLYLHPDDQIEMLKARQSPDEPIPNVPEIEWVLPTRLAEKWTLKSFAGVFDSLPPPSSRTPGRPKRIILAIVHEDSTVVYYFMHDGIVKPRQN